MAVITGLMGSGKTWLLSRLFNQIPPDLYTSTGLAEQSFRGLLHHMINISFSSWEPFTHKQILEFLASLFYDMLPASNPHLEADVFPTSTPNASSTPSPSLSLTQKSSMSPIKGSSRTLLPTTESPTMQSMMRMVKTPKDTGSQEMLELVHMIDTGGQPQLLESLPSLIHHANLAVLVLNLIYGLDEHPTLHYHEEGKVYKKPLPSQYTNRQIMQKLASTLQAKRYSQKEGNCFQLLVVATHRDCIPKVELEAKVKAFDLALRESLLPSNDEELICFSANQIPFVLNLLNPDKEDMIQLDLIRSRISDSELGEVVKTPGSFLVFEQVLIEFANKKVKRDILSLSECQLIGERLKMKPDEVHAALIFFHRQLTLLYFHQILPNLVFTRPQTPLDCINAVVKFSYKVWSGDVMAVKRNLVSSLRDGIITEEILSHEQLTQCFIPGLYEPHHAIELLSHTFTLAPLSREIQSKIDTVPSSASRVKREKEEYLMMSLRDSISEKEILQYLPPPSEIAPLVVHFTNNCVPLSCFSRTISCLLAMYDWKLSRADDRSPQCLAHNIVSLYKPQTPGQIILVDKGHSFQIHVKIDEDTEPCSSQICFHIRETIFSAINDVFEVLKLTKIKVSPAFLCPCSRQPSGHTASAYLFRSQWLLHCSVAEKTAGPAQKKHEVWLEVPEVEQEKPSLPKLLTLKVPQKVGTSFMEFGILLLSDEDGTLIDALEDECRGRHDKIVRRILMEWVKGRGRALTWKTLSDTLRECELTVLADNIDSSYT